MVKRLFASCICLGLLVGCQLGNQEKLQVVNVNGNPDSFQALAVTNSKVSMTLRHMITDNDLFVECYIPDFKFTDHSNDQSEGAGYLKVSVDHQKAFSVNKAAFIVKDLSKGNHHISVMLVNANGKKIKGMEKQFFVNIP
ncbi:hypothetical protein [Pseudalkalibacillus berkeleyi]|uniref:Lipoprotein n=1 Tax=Pseudalkalibacillus berkeleyi TaxID=1069813 RepID=A0ABS9GZG4_9BACL|nr:hypothetical protein [Pseudalkalibacillus berkeleyi]MCF6136983.1 hypothetical protein [Pseudalkalibacillus berkeleyi]